MSASFLTPAEQRWSTGRPLYRPAEDPGRKIAPGRFRRQFPTDLGTLTDSLHRDGDRLDLGIVPQRVFAQFAPDAAHLEAAEGGGGVEDVVAVDPDRAGLEFGGHA